MGSAAPGEVGRGPWPGKAGVAVERVGGGQRAAEAGLGRGVLLLTNFPSETRGPRASFPVPWPVGPGDPG